MEAANRSRRLALAALAALPILLLIPAASAPAASSGWVRLAHLSPDTPSVDVYLYSFGNPEAKIVLDHVGYGAVSPYQRLSVGRYTVAMRGDDASPDDPPVLSTNVEVKAGEAITVAGYGRSTSIKLVVLTDELTTPPGKATIRVLQASLQNPEVDVSTDEGSLAQDLRFPGYTDYNPVTPGAATVNVTGQLSEADVQINFAVASIHTLFVLDKDADSGELELMDITDASGTTQTPVGGVNTGLGGTATGPVGDRPAPAAFWLAVAAAATLAFGLTKLRTARRSA